MIKIGIGMNEWAKNLPYSLEETCLSLGIDYQIIDFTDITDVDVTHLAPALLYKKPAASSLYRHLESLGVKTLNKVSAIELADDKALTFRELRRAGVPQLETEIILLELSEMQRTFKPEGTIYKRTHGGQGRWVRLAQDYSQVDAIYREFLVEGPGELVVQPFIKESEGETIRVIVTSGEVLASAIRKSGLDFRSNVSLGGTQQTYQLSSFETEISLAATQVLGLAHAGVDLIRTNDGTRVLEVNACPDFTSMKNFSKIDISKTVLQRLIDSTSP